MNYEINSRFTMIENLFMDHVRAKFYLPKFVGGEGGIGTFRNYKKNYRKLLKEQTN